MKVIGFTGASGAGKTTLMEALIARFAGCGLRLAAIKHAHHGFDLDRPGKDSYRFRAAGASQVLIASGERWALLSEQPEPGDPRAALERQLARLAPCDLILVEGFRGQAGVPFIEVRRSTAAGPAAGDTPPPPGPGVIALACDANQARRAAGLGLPVLPLDDIAAIAAFVSGALELPT